MVAARENTKLELLVLLANSPRTYTELRERLKISDPALQRHLNDLQTRGIVGKEEDGRWALKLESTLPSDEARLQLLPSETLEAGNGQELYEPSGRLRWFAYEDLNPLISPGVLGIAKFAVATLLTLEVYPLVKMAKEMKARFETPKKKGGDEYDYSSWLQHLIVDSVSFDHGFLAAVRRRGVAAQRQQLASTWSIAESFVDTDLGFNYTRAYEASRKLLEGKRFRERIMRQWTFEGELKMVGYAGELTEDQFFKMWGWTRIKVYVLGEWRARKIWRELLSAGLKGCGLLS
ncbi:MAG: winged helix-turn-helix domain-containing protein [Nitrososphaerales archaeon]|nr:winged helix-turn-helix domain-containing protein [Nitrososphaerales archaeon]